MGPEVGNISMFFGFCLSNEKIFIFDIENNCTILILSHNIALYFLLFISFLLPKYYKKVEKATKSK